MHTAFPEFIVSIHAAKIPHHSIPFLLDLLNSMLILCLSK
jgi:hypothetical protein